MVGNNPASYTDLFGLFKESHCCSAAQLTALTTAEAAASAAVDSVISLLDGKYAELNLPVWIRSTHREIPIDYTKFVIVYRSWLNAMKMTFEPIKRGIQANDYGVECETSCAKRKKAYINGKFFGRGFVFWDNDIHFCPPFFALAPTQQAQTFLHELSHLFADTKDDYEYIRLIRPYKENPKIAQYVELFVFPEYEIEKLLHNLLDDFPKTHE